MAVVDLTIPVGKGERDEIVVCVTDAGEVELRQLGQVVTIAKERRVEFVDAVVVAYKALDHLAKAQKRAPKES